MSQIYRIKYDESYNNSPQYEYAISYEAALRFKKIIENEKQLTHNVEIYPVQTIDDYVYNRDLENGQNS